MVNVNNIFTSNYLRAIDLEDKPHLVTIKAVGVETMQDSTQKLCVLFQEFELGLLLNKTNAHNLSDYLGPETDGWVGKQTVMFPAWVDFQGKSVEAIRVRKPKPAASHGNMNVGKTGNGLPSGSPGGPPKGHPAAMEDLDEDQIPF